MDYVCYSRQRKLQSDTVKDKDDVDVGLVLPQRSAVSQATDMSVVCLVDEFLCSYLSYSLSVNCNWHLRDSV